MKVECFFNYFYSFFIKELKKINLKKAIIFVFLIDLIRSTKKSVHYVLWRKYFLSCILRGWETNETEIDYYLERLNGCFICLWISCNRIRNLKHLHLYFQTMFMLSSFKLHCFVEKEITQWKSQWKFWLSFDFPFFMCLIAHLGKLKLSECFTKIFVFLLRGYKLRKHFVSKSISMEIAVSIFHSVLHVNLWHLLDLLNLFDLLYLWNSMCFCVKWRDWELFYFHKVHVSYS